MDLAAFRHAIGDRYALEHQIGQGGMAFVHLARDLKHDRRVAIKILKPELGSAIGAARFLEEIRVTAHLQHPHLLPLFDSGEAAGLLYYVMPFVQGETLRARLQREGALPIADAIRLAGILVDAVDHAHRQGVVHRDLKPENILLVDGQPLVADFGIALAVSEAAATRMTHTGLSIGTPQYMSPEQASGERGIDARSDVYALGAILYEMLTGRAPHTGANGRVVLAKVLTDRPVSVRAQRDTVPEDLDAAVMRALARLPADRWQSAAEFARALRVALPPGSGAQTPAAGATAGRPHPTLTRRLVLAGLVAIVAAAAGFGIWRQSLSQSGTPGAAGGHGGLPSSLAVLPFENRSADQADEYFSDGLTEEVLHRLAQVRGLRVAARTSSFAFKNQALDVREIAGRLNVDAVVSGSVRRSGDVLRVTVQLIDVADGSPLWSQSYERTARDAFSVQDEIAQAIAQRLDPDAPDETSGRGGPPPEAFDFYLQGRFEWNRRTPQGTANAIELLTRAIAIAPDYARAHGALAEAYSAMGFYDYLPPRVAFTRAREAAVKAATLDPAMPEAPNTLAYVAMYYDWDFAAAEREYRRAIELNPRYPVAHQWYGNLLALTGRRQEAIDAMRRAQELDPLAAIPRAALGWAFNYLRDFESAESELRRTLVTHPGYFLAQHWLGESLEAQRRYPEALAAADEALRTSPDNVNARLARARVVARLGRQAEARDTLRQLNTRAAQEYVAAYPRALVAATLSEVKAALALLDEAAANREHSIAFLRVDPWLDSLRREPEFEALVAKTLKP